MKKENKKIDSYWGPEAMKDKVGDYTNGKRDSISRIVILSVVGVIIICVLLYISGSVK